jgi:uncharacterized phage-like protein YoqJ
MRDVPHNEGSPLLLNQKEKTAAFTGHRALPNDTVKLKLVTEAAIVSLVEKGVVHFGAGGAVGFDTLVAKLVLDLRDTLFPHISLIQVLPFKGMESKWSPEQKNDFNDINRKADKVVWLADRYTGDELYHIRNRYLVDNAAHLIAYCKNTQARSGAASCCRYAVRQGTNIILLSD